MRSAVLANKRLTCVLYSLDSTSEWKTVAQLFSIGRSTVANILHEFCDVIVEVFFLSIIKFPVPIQEIQQTTDCFFHKYGSTMCIGSIDGTHINIKPPTGEEIAYFNHKKYHSVILLAVVDASLKFTYVNTGVPSRCNDASLYS